MRKMALGLSIIFCYLVLTTAVIGEDMDYGRFEGTVQAEWLRGKPSERRMKLLADFVYIDPKGKKWTAPAGYVTDGASIPRAFWALVGGPLDGQYREAAVIHDVYCDSKSEPWRDVHRIFYYANRAAGLPELKSKVLYAAVRVGGPKWGSNDSKCYSCHKMGDDYHKDGDGKLINTPGVSDQQARQLADWVEKSNPSLEDIDAYVSGKFPKSTFGH